MGLRESRGPTGQALGIIFALNALSNAIAELPQAALTVCEALVAQHGWQLGDIRTHAAADAFEEHANSLLQISSGQLSRQSRLYITIII